MVFCIGIPHAIFVKQLIESASIIIKQTFLFLLLLLNILRHFISSDHFLYFHYPYV